jgi:hypothetical protein
LIEVPHRFVQTAEVVHGPTGFEQAGAAFMLEIVEV